MKQVQNLIGTTIILAFAIGLGGCQEAEARAEVSSERTAQTSKKQTDAEKSNAKAAKPVSKPVNIKVETVSPTNLTEYIVANGTTQAFRELTYSAEVPGRIEALTVDIGDKVRKGQILARIDYATLQAQADQAETSYNLAKSTFERLSKLKDEDIISKQRIDEAQSTMESARAGVAIAEANVKKAVVRSTYSGIVGAKFVEKGEYVGPGTPMFKVVDYKTIILEARLPETQVAAVDRNAAVDVQIDALNATFTGKVDTLIPTADHESKTFTLRIKIDNSDYRILIGMSATVRLATRHYENVLAVSQSAVIEERDERSVFVVNGDKAEKRIVRLGAIQGDKVAVTEGLKAGDLLVVLGQRDLENGKPIRIVE